QPHPQDCAGGTQLSLGPREVLADPLRVDAGPADPRVEGAVGEGAGAEHAVAVRAGRSSEPRILAERQEPVGEPHLVHGGQQRRLRSSQRRGRGKYSDSTQEKSGDYARHPGPYSSGHEWGAYKHRFRTNTGVNANYV